MTWLLLAFITPILWSWVTIIDNYFVHSVYEDEYDGAIISGIFQSFPWILVLLGVVHFQFPGVGTALWALGAGVLLLLSFLCYFKALFAYNDSVLIQILWNLSIPVVPFFAWLILSEKLLSIHYIGIALAFGGVTLFVLDGKIGKDEFWKVAGTMLGAVVALSLSMVFSKEAYESGAGFWDIYLLFCAGATLLAVSWLVVDSLEKKRHRIGKIFRLSKKYFGFFFLAESLSVIGTLTSQGAINLSPSVSFVAVIEALVPVFAMISSFVLVLIFGKIGKDNLQSLYREQFSNLPTKVLALVLIAGGIYIIG